VLFPREKGVKKREKGVKKWKRVLEKGVPLEKGSAGQIRIRYGKWRIVFISILYTPWRGRIVFLAYCIHIQAVEYEYDMNIFKYILSQP
jgi:hypothetical protein